jgi:hypothetical protein
VRTPKSGVGLARSQGRGQAAGTSSSHRAGSDDHRTRNWIDEQLRFPGAQASRTFRPGGTAASGAVNVSAAFQTINHREPQRAGTRPRSRTDLNGPGCPYGVTTDQKAALRPIFP